MKPAIKDFDPSMAFISEATRRCNAQPRVELPTNIHLSRLVAYLYMATSYLKQDTYVVVPDHYHPIISRMFGGHDRLVDKEPEQQEDVPNMDVVTMRVSNYTDVLMKGQVMMPLFVSSSSAVVYNIHYTNAEALLSDSTQQTSAHVEGCLAFFNTLVRAGKGGITRIIWKDPIMQDTKLQTHTYDQMFAIHVCNAYLVRVNPSYRRLGLNTRLAMCLSCLEVLEEDSMTIKVPITKEYRPITQKGSHATPLPSSLEGALIADDDPVLTEDIRKHYYTCILAMLSLSKVNRKQAFTLYLHGAFKDYSFMSSIAAIYKSVLFYVWCAETVNLPSVSLKRDPGMPSFVEDNAEKFLVSLSPPDLLLASFTGTSALVLTSETTYTSHRLVMPLFSKSTLTYSMIIPKQATKITDGLAAIRSNAIRACDAFNHQYRDTRRWGYTYTTLERKTISDSYDNCYIKRLEDNIK